MSGYVVAKANQTAMAFVAKAENERDGWIVLGRADTYAAACAMRDRQNARLER